MAFNKESERGDAPRARRGGAGIRRRKKVCEFCGGGNRENGENASKEVKKEVKEISYKDSKKLAKYVSERGKILPRRVTGCCAKHQRALTVAIKRARHMAIMPYVTD